MSDTSLVTRREIKAKEKYLGEIGTYRYFILWGWVTVPKETIQTKKRRDPSVILPMIICWPETGKPSKDEG